MARVLFVIGSLGLGGAESQMVALAKGLAGRGWQCKVFVLEPIGPLSTSLHDIGVTVHDGGYASSDALGLKLLKLPRALGRLISLSSRFRPDVLHAYLPLTNFLGALVGRVTGVPRVITSRRALGTHQDRHSLSKSFDRLANRWSHLVIANSEAVAKDTAQRDGLARDKLKVIYNGLDAQRFELASRHRKRLRRALGLDANTLGIVTVANLISYKGHVELLSALPRVQNTAKDLISIGYQDTDETEHQFAREVADHLGTEHHEQLLKPDALGFIEHLAEVLDEPKGDSSCLPTYLLSKYTRRFVTVALSGDGGDELFGGYGRYTHTINEFGTWLERLKNRIRGRAKATPADRYLSPRWLIYQPEQVDMLMGGLPDGVRACIAGWRTRLNDESQPLIHRMRNLDVEFYMPGAVLAKVDRMSMQESLEVRCPLLDRGVAAFARQLPATSCWQPPAVAKYLLKELAARYLPAPLIHRRKMGFGLPTQSWSRETMIAMANDVLLGESACLGSLLDRAALTNMVHAQSVPGQFSIYQLWPLLILELWLRAHRSNASKRFAEGAAFSEQVRSDAMDQSVV